MKSVVHERAGDKATIKTECRAGEGRKHVEKVEVDTLKYIERKLTEKGVQRLERHPADGLPLKHDPKKGHGGKYTWEGPGDEAENELDPAPPVLDERDPNYVEEEKEEPTGSDGGGLVVGQVEVAKVAEEGVARIEVDPLLKANYEAVGRDEEGCKRVTKHEVETHNIDTLKYIEKKLMDKGVHRKDRRPASGIPLGKQSKSGHGGKFTWEGPADEAEYELDDVPAAIDEKDPNYVDEEAEKSILKGEVSGVEGMVVGEVDVAKVAAEGVARVDVHPQLQPNA
nr:uncharacterized protein LOC109181099 [Ipomoea batatas]